MSREKQEKILKSTTIYDYMYGLHGTGVYERRVMVMGMEELRCRERFKPSASTSKASLASILIQSY